MSGTGSAPPRRPLWITGRTDALAVSHHPAAPDRALDQAVILCPPLGFEYTHSHRTLRHLADALAAEGVDAFRLDYSGSGDSSGEPLDPARVASWLADIEACMDAAAEISGATRISLLGLRMGGTLAALVADRRPVHRLVLWSPVVSGRRYMREWRLVARTSSPGSAVTGSGTRDADTVLESGGFPMSSETARAIESIDLAALKYQVADSVLVVQRADVAPRKGFVGGLVDRGLTVQTIDADGYDDMMAEPQETVVPLEAVRGITEWVAAGTVPRRCGIPSI